MKSIGNRQELAGAELARLANKIALVVGTGGGMGIDAFPPQQSDARGAWTGTVWRRELRAVAEGRPLKHWIAPVD
jgi:hypothetical protein